MPVLKDLFGDRIADMVATLKEDQVSPPTRSEGVGFLVMKRGKTKSSYDDLKTSVEDLLVEQGRPELMYKLISSAQIGSRYLPAPSVAPNTNGPTIPNPDSANVPIPGNTPPQQIPSGNPNIPIPGETKIAIPDSQSSLPIPTH